MSGAKSLSPKRGASSFHCPHCGVLAQQAWFRLIGVADYQANAALGGWAASQCHHCNAFGIWLEERLFFPFQTSRPKPNRDMDTRIVETYEEAVSIADASPRGAAALLRLCVQMLCIQLGEGGKNINEDIKSLVQKGLPVQIQQALDVVRVVGNNAVHPGEINLEDQPDTVEALFVLVNAVADRMLTQPKAIASLYGGLPPSIQQAIAKRDGG